MTTTDDNREEKATQTEGQVISISFVPVQTRSRSRARGAAIVKEVLGDSGEDKGGDGGGDGGVKGKRRNDDQDPKADPQHPKGSAVAKRQKIHNPQLEMYTEEELMYYKRLQPKEKKNVAMTEERMQLINCDAVPIRFKVLLSGVDDKLKAIAIQKLNYMYSLEESSTEYYNTMHWIESVCKIPFNVYKSLPVKYSSPRNEIRDFLTNMKTQMNNIVYGHTAAKDHIIRLLAQWIANPDAKGMVIGIQGPMGCGKCFAKNTPVLMYDGTIKLVQDVVVGDVLMGDEGMPRNVLALGGGQDLMYTVSDSDGGSYTVNSEHILCLKVAARGVLTSCGSNRWIAKHFDKRTLCVCTKEFDSRLEAAMYIETLPFEEEDQVLELTIKRFLGIPERIRKQWLRGYRKAVEIRHDGVADADADFAPFVTGQHLFQHVVSGKGVAQLHATRRATLALRTQVIEGLHSMFPNCSIIHAHPQPYEVAEDILFIARSSGHSAHKTFVGSGEDGHDMYQVTINTNRLPENLNVHIDVAGIGMGQYYGFMIDGNERFMLGDCTVTHNTTLVKDGICAVLGLPFAFIPLGGANDGCYLEGHSYTYQGATWGKIVDVLMKCGCMNPVMFFDELDKVSFTHRGEEIINILIHLTDASQNDRFNDKYFSEFEFNLSRSLVIFSYNNEDNVNPILRDRMIKIQTKGYNVKDKIAISQQHMIPSMLKEYNYNNNEVTFTEDVLKRMIDTIEPEEGVRNLKRAIQDVISNLNLNRLLAEKEGSEPHSVTEKDIDKYVHNKKRSDDRVSYMYT